MSHATPTFDPSTGFWPTPNTMDFLPQRSLEALKRQATVARKGRSKPANLREAVNPEAVQVYAANASPPLISSLEGSPVSLFPSPGSDAAQAMTVSSGRRCAVLLKKSGPVGSWLRMGLGSSRW